MNYTTRNGIPFPDPGETDWATGPTGYNQKIQDADSVIASLTSENTFTQPNTFNNKITVQDGYGITAGSLRINQSSLASLKGLLIYGNGALSTDGYLDMSFRAADILSIQVADNTTQKTIALQPDGGNVGIGTITPAEKLHVDGNIKASALQINADAGTADTDDALYFGGRTTSGSGRLRYDAATQTFYFEKRGASTWAVA